MYTILSQHTSDINSIRAFNSLIKKFKSFELLKDAPVKSVESAIYRGGLAKIKASRIKEVLKIIYENIGSFDLSFLSEIIWEYISPFFVPEKPGQPFGGSNHIFRASDFFWGLGTAAPPPGVRGMESPAKKTLGLS